MLTSCRFRGKFEAADAVHRLWTKKNLPPVAPGQVAHGIWGSRNVMRLGSNKVIPVDIRLIGFRQINKDIPANGKEG